ncbi:hypothetical protein ZIOFF_064069 [Zingiber officinale]|uniref:Uncharacterized protein n=1 Tax=Zingiber officinale TaxID=94328 RepID=A0A8J5CFA8_ZINOF|nr:hypothetical protein ZIOFF_064069 [Zingiber officinale]
MPTFLNLDRRIAKSPQKIVSLAPAAIATPQGIRRSAAIFFNFSSRNYSCKHYVKRLVIDRPASGCGEISSPRVVQ